MKERGGPLRRGPMVYQEVGDPIVAIRKRRERWMKEVSSSYDIKHYTAWGHIPGEVTPERNAHNLIGEPRSQRGVKRNSGRVKHPGVLSICKNVPCVNQLDLPEKVKGGERNTAHNSP